MAFISSELGSVSMTHVLTWVRCLPFIQLSLGRGAGSLCTNLAMTCGRREKEREGQAERTASRHERTGHSQPRKDGGNKNGGEKWGSVFCKGHRINRGVGAGGD